MHAVVLRFIQLKKNYRETIKAPGRSLFIAVVQPAIFIGIIRRAIKQVETC